MPINFLEPWYAVEDSREISGLATQLAREVGPQHQLFQVSVRLIARRQDNDDCLFELSDNRVADVHLTWRQTQETNPAWPATGIYDSLEEWAELVMRPANAEWIDD